MIHMHDPLETSDLLAFARTVETRSLSRAALELGVPRATVSRRLTRLETQLGVRLLRRSTRKMALTDAGEELYRHARSVIEAVREAEAAVRRTDGVVRGPLRVSLPPSDGGLHRLLLAFTARYPEIRLEVIFSTAHIDLVSSGYDVAIRAGADLDPGLVARTLLRMRTLAVAAPRYLATAGTPTTPADLVQHKCILGFTRGEWPVSHWPLTDGGQVRVSGVLVSNDIQLQRAAAVDGRGIALLPESLIAPALAAKTLVAVLPGVVGAQVQVSVVYPERELLPPTVRAFVEFVTEHWRSYLPTPGEAFTGNSLGTSPLHGDHARPDRG